MASLPSFFSLAVPPLQLPQTLRIPQLPGGMSPAGAFQIFIAGLGTLAQFLPEKVKKKTKQEQDQEDHEDNKRVVKKLHVAQTIDRVLGDAEVEPIVARVLIQMLKGGRSWTKPSLTSADELFEPLRQKLKTEIRLKLLQQANKRTHQTHRNHPRRGKLYVHTHDRVPLKGGRPKGTRNP